MLTSAANVPDISRALDVLDGYPPIAGRRGRPRRRFDTLLADKGYSSDAFPLALDIHDGLVGLDCVLICWRRPINWTARRSF